METDQGGDEEKFPSEESNERTCSMGIFATGNGWRIHVMANRPV